MFAGATLPQWLGFHLLVAALIAADLLLSRRTPSLRSTFLLTLGWISAALIFALWLARALGRAPALEYITGYTIEQSLSLDNLFVFLLLFRSFAVPPAAQRRLLFWGILGAILMRGLFILAGVALLARFRWIQFAFAAILFFAALRMLSHSGDAAPRWITFITRRISGTDSSSAAPLLFALLAIELTDVLFALDSVPAVLAVTHNAYIAYTSNLFAVLSLRALYFVLAGTLTRLRRLHYGLAALLAFIAAKMLLAPWLTISTPLSLAIILSVLGITIAASLLCNQKVEVCE